MTPVNGFVEATREKLNLRMAICGPSKSGKSFTSLRLAMVLAKHYGGKVAVIDSENGSARKYVGLSPDGIPFQFAVKELTTYSPTEYTSSIEAAGKAGFKVIVVDSLSHAWMGKDGALETVDKTGKNKFTDGWRAVTPMHNRMIDAILNSPAHVLVTMRVKMEYTLEESTNAQGNVIKVPKKLALAPVQRQGMEYEFDILADIDGNHIMNIGNSRCPALDGAVIIKPGASLANSIIEWLDTGEDVAPEHMLKIERVDDEMLGKLYLAIEAKNWKTEAVKKLLTVNYGVDRLSELTPSQAEQFYKTRLGGGTSSRGGKQAGAGARNSLSSQPANAPAQAVGNDAGDEAPAKSHGEEISEQFEDAIENGGSEPPTPGALSQFEKTRALYLKSGKGGTPKAAAKKLETAIAKRTPNGSIDPADLNVVELEMLEAMMLDKMNPIPVVDKEGE